MKSIFFCKEETSVINALKKINSNGCRCLIVLNNTKKFLGVLSDGDLRKKISKGYKLGEKIKSIYNKKPLYFFEKNYSLEKIEKIFIEKKIDLIPILKKNKTIKKVFFLNEFIKEDQTQKKNSIAALIMAGGKGTRLDPFTKVLPKPLIPIKGKPIIEIIIEKFIVSNINDIYVSLNYKSNLHQIIKRRDATILIPSDNYPFNMIVESILDLKRFPILIVLDDKDQSALDGLSITHQAFNGVVNKDDISVLFRLDNSKSEFNDYVRENKLNNSVAKNTKIVYISSNKLPKTLFKADWRPNCVISYGGRGLRFNNVTSYVQQFDLQIVYENASSNTYWNRSERKLINAIV